jgi:hypothetical protein
MPALPQDHFIDWKSVIWILPPGEWGKQGGDLHGAGVEYKNEQAEENESERSFCNAEDIKYSKERKGLIVSQRRFAK